MLRRRATCEEVLEQTVRGGQLGIDRGHRGGRREEASALETHGVDDTRIAGEAGRAGGPRILDALERGGHRRIDARLNPKGEDQIGGRVVDEGQVAGGEPAMCSLMSR